MLPVWHCGPTETASACKECPPTPEGQTASCNDGFNALVLLPLVLAPGYFLPPPVGLPTLTVGPGGPKTYEPPKPTEPPKETQESEKSTEESTFSDPEPTASCVLPMFKASDKAMPKITTSSLGGIPTPPPTWKPDTSKNPLPILPFQEEGAIGACGGGGSLGRYFTSGFHQFGDTFSRTDGLNAIKEFCALHARNGSLLGPDGFKIFNKNAPQNPANVSSEELE